MCSLAQLYYTKHNQLKQHCSCYAILINYILYNNVSLDYTFIYILLIIKNKMGIPHLKIARLSNSPILSRLKIRSP